MRTTLVALALLAVFGCEKSKKAEKNAGKAEVEFVGLFSAGEAKAAKYVFVAQVEPCTPVPEKPTRYGEAKLDGPGTLFAEFWIPQGSKGHACVYGLDEAGKVVAAAGTAQNPMTFEGEGEVMKTKLDFALKAP